MANPWFRLYAEFATDPKVQMLSEAMQRRLLMLFCFRCNGSVTLQDEEVTFLLRITDAEWTDTKRLFIAKGFIDSANSVLNWDKRQYRGDSSAERVRKHREAKKTANVTDVTSCNVTVTPPEQIQNRTDTEQKQDISSRVARSPKRSNYTPEFEEFWELYPPNGAGKQEAAKRYHLAISKGATHDEIYEGTGHYRLYIESRSDGRQYTAHATTWLNQGRWTVRYEQQESALDQLLRETRKHNESRGGDAGAATFGGGVW